MSTTAASDARAPRSGTPELSRLGRQVELLRLERGLSKQALARAAGTSRQQLWRVMTGKSELTSSFCERLADVLGIDSRALRDPEAFAAMMSGGSGWPGAMWRETGTRAPSPQRAEAGRSGRVGLPSLADYLGDVSLVERTLATLPGGAEGRAIKRRLLDAIEDAAAGRGVKLPAEFFILRGRVVNGDG
jgi:transcriptional regulator with XRE-family HTH domain